jgi:hypothetical protein
MSASSRTQRLAVLLRDLEAFLSLDPRRWAARVYNKAVGRAVGRVAGRLYLRRRRR